MNKLLTGLVMSCIPIVSQAASVISSWDYINEAGFSNAQTGYAVTHSSGVKTTLDPNTLAPMDSTGQSTSGGATWFQNDVDNLYYDFGSLGSVSGDSKTGVTAGASGQSIGTSILSTGSLADELCWGNGPSCIAFKDSSGGDSSRVEGTATTTTWGPLSWNQGTAMEHSNLPTGDPSLTFVEIIDGLKLYSPDLLFDLPPIELGIDVIFNETYANATNLWSYAPDDAFIVTLDPLLAAITSVGPGFIDFTVNLDLTGFVSAGAHTQYQVITRLSGLEPVPIPGDTTFGLLTTENSVNMLDAQFAIRAVGVPAPSTVALFGLSLILIAALRRKR
ncbi:PEP-CTERM sorting domain-containing protein [Catenovulum sediminis]|uniref:PEP-CTERM sorting domain-containing protein n=1 Tax=Catenovulum sediminis TaxID=1740262 RepID=A0ABV1RFK8_9ALTE|nr:PEP-CTERM sorting domain-containing protein [Catenovulum sediminis]